MHEHEDSHLVLIVSGTYVTQAAAGQIVGNGAVILNSPGTRHDDHLTGPGRVCIFSFAPSAFRAREGHPELVSDPVAGRLLSAMIGEATVPDESTALAIDGHCAELSALLTRMNSTIRARRTPQWLLRGRDAVVQSRGIGPSLSRLAADAGVHEMHFVKAYRRYFGMTPAADLRRIKLQRAARMLVRSSLPLSEIALAAGYADQPAFTKAFARSLGQTPSVFRSLWRKNA